MIEFQEFSARKIVNVHRHVDGPWFWDKYSAHPYVGCRSGCEFCFLRGGRYLGRRDPATFDTLIQVKVNAPALLKKELARLEKDVIVCGDWQQPAEDRYRLSREMLEVVYDFGFPLFVVERSPLIARDLDLLESINARAWTGVVMSISSMDDGVKRAFEPRSPGVKRRLQAMKSLAEAGILTGAALMPLIPKVGDDPAQIEEIIRAVRDHGGTFVLGGSLTMEGTQAERTLVAARKRDPGLEAEWRELYGWNDTGKPNYSPPGTQAERTLVAARIRDPGLEAEWRELYGWNDTGKPNYSPPAPYSARLLMTIRELCIRFGMKDRMPRYILPGPLASNKVIAERLFLRTYDLELEQAQSSRIWAYRRAAWTVDEYAESIDLLYRQGGEAALRELPGIGPRIAAQIARWLREDGETRRQGKTVPA